MENSTIIATIFGILLVLLVTSITVQTQAQSVTEVQSNPPPNKVLNVVRQSGNCPQNVGLSRQSQKPGFLIKSLLADKNYHRNRVSCRGDRLFYNK